MRQGCPFAKVIFCGCRQALLPLGFAGHASELRRIGLTSLTTIVRPAPFSRGPSGLAAAPTFLPSSGMHYSPCVQHLQPPCGCSMPG